MTCILSYNILSGGKGRIDTIERVIRLADPDVVGLVEATNQEMVRELARRLGMEYRTNELQVSSGKSCKPEIALLSRLPIISSDVHASPLLRTGSLLEVCMQEAHGEKLTVFVTHLTADFFHGRGGDSPRRKEVREILRLMRNNRGPHVLVGDFNALAPGDQLKASNLLRYLVALDKSHKTEPEAMNGHPTLAYVIPPFLRFLIPVLHFIPRSKLLSLLFDELGGLYAPRGSIGLLHDAGYVDCFRYVNPRSWGFTCPAAAPAGRIDYLFANPLLATRLSACKVVLGNGEVSAREASDHLPVLAEFGIDVQTACRPRLDIPVEAHGTPGEVL